MIITTKIIVIFRRSRRRSRCSKAQLAKRFWIEGDEIGGMFVLIIAIIIIGVGDACFDKMDELDGDDGLWDANGNKAERDLV